MVFHCVQYFRPALAKVKSDKHKCGYPDHSATVRVQRKTAIANLRGARDNRGEVTHSWNKVADHQRPVADPIEPRMHALNVFFLDVQKLSKARVQKLPADGPADNVATGNSANAAAQRAGNSGNQLQVSLINQKPAASEQEFVRHRQADDAQNQQRKDREIPVSRNPVEDCRFQLVRIPNFVCGGPRLSRSEFLHAPILDFGDVDRSRTVERDSMRKVKLAGNLSVG
jgi:hypothetical protein